MGAVAGMSHHQRAVERGFGKMLAPEVERADAEPADHGFGRLGLAMDSKTSGVVVYP